jgi:hypothetical protein
VKTIRVALGGFLFAVAVTGLWAFGSVAEVACSSPEKQGGEGAQCEVFSDCSGGLFCVQMVCTSDAAALVMIEEAGATPQAEAASSVPESDATGVGTPDGGGGTGEPPGDDASVGPDVTAMPAEAGTAPVDEAAPPDEASSAPTDDDL